MARHKRSRNKGYWFRAGRGWYVTTDKSSKPLLNAQGNPIRFADSAEEAKQAYARYLLEAAPPVKGKGLTVLEACQVYFDHAESGHPETYRLRAGFLFDFCTGLPPRFRNSKVRPTAKNRIHPGCGAKSVMGVTCLDLEKWVEAHPGWKSPRAALQAVRRAINYCKESGLIESSPLKGLKVPKSGRRVAYLTPETEEAIHRYARPALAMAIKVCIRVGARPEIEFARLDARHVEETPRGQRWRFLAEEAKGRQKERTIYVPEEIAQIVRAQIKQHKGRVFRDDQGKPWTRRTLQYAFRRLKGRLLKKGVTPDEPFIPYTCRHTYAKRMLGGYWGAPVTLEVLAGLMGNTPAICWQHYTQWSGQYTDPFWAAIGSTSHNGGRETSPA